MRTGRFAGARVAGLLLLLLPGCRDPEPDNLVRKTIGPAGGLVSSYDEVLTIVLQPGALSEDVDVEVFPSEEPPAIFGLVYRVRPDIPLVVDAEITYRRVLPSNPNAAALGAIRRDDYTEQMGHWRPLPRLALDVEQQWILASDDELSLYYGLLEDTDAPPLPTGDTDVEPTTGMGPGSGPGTDTSAGSSTGVPEGSTTDPVDPTTGGGMESTDGPPPGTTDGGAASSSDGAETDPGSSSSDGGMAMPLCSDGIPVAGELCLVAGADYPAGLDPIDVGLGNFDADPALDVVTLDLGALEVGLLSGVGDGTLMAPGAGAAAGAGPAELRVGDFTGDGILDVVVVDTVADSVGLLAGNGAGFDPLASAPTGAGVVDLADADFDGNAARDLSVLNATDGTVQMILGGAGGLMPGPAAMVGAGIDAAVANGSLNAAFDAFDDIIAVGAGGYHAWASDGTGAGYIGDVGGAFGGGGTFVELVVGDIDSDGNPDVVALDVAADTMVVGLSTGGPAFFDFAVVPPVAVGIDPSDVVLVDLDDDGDLDAVVVNALSNDLMVFEWNAGYAMAFTFPTGTAPSGVAAGDLSGDGVLDLVVSNQGSDTVTVVLSDP